MVQGFLFAFKQQAFLVDCLRDVFVALEQACWFLLSTPPTEIFLFPLRAKSCQNPAGLSALNSWIHPSFLKPAFKFNLACFPAISRFHSKCMFLRHFSSGFRPSSKEAARVSPIISSFSGLLSISFSLFFFEFCLVLPRNYRCLFPSKKAKDVNIPGF